MKITCYRSALYQKTATYEVSRIESQYTPEEMTDEIRSEMNNGGEAMCNFELPDGTWMAVPWNFVIEITD